MSTLEGRRPRPFWPWLLFCGDACLCCVLRRMLTVNFPDDLSANKRLKNESTKWPPLCVPQRCQTMVDLINFWFWDSQLPAPWWEFIYPCAASIPCCPRSPQPGQGLRARPIEPRDPHGLARTRKDQARLHVDKYVPRTAAGRHERKLFLPPLR